MGIRIRCLASTRIQRQELENVAPEEQSDLSRFTSDDGDGRPDAMCHIDEVEEKEKREDDTKLVRDELSDADSTSSDESSDTDSDLDSTSVSSSLSQRSKQIHKHVSCIQEAQLSPDGTCIFTTDYDRAFSVYPMNNNNLEETETRSFTPYARFTSADPIWAFAVNPYFDVNDANTTTVLVSRRDQYITLHNALWDISRFCSDEEQSPPIGPVDISTKLASYKLVNNLTEEVIAPLSLTYSHDGAYFYAGHQNSISVFDLSYTNEPISKIATIPSARSKLKGGGRGFKGHISALSLSPSSTSFSGGILAAGSRTRYVGLYDAVSGEEITHFALPGTVNGFKLKNEFLTNIIGDGVTHMKWSPDGNYLYIAERVSDAILIYDARNFSMNLGYCAGRQAFTKEKLGFDVWSSEDVYGKSSSEVWAGGTDGKIRVWRDPCLKEGAIEADEVLDVGDGPVVGALVHPYGNVAVAASGRYQLCVDEKEQGRGRKRGGGKYPQFKEWGRLDILGLTSY